MMIPVKIQYLNSRYSPAGVQQQMFGYNQDKQVSELEKELN